MPTIHFRQLSFFVWKVTILYGLFAVGLLVSQFAFNKPLIQTMLGKEISLPERIWSQLNLAWAIFFIVCGAVNLYIGFNLSEATWVTFKTIVFPATIFVFTLLTVAYIYRFLPKDDINQEETQPKHKD